MEEAPVMSPSTLSPDALRRDFALRCLISLGADPDLAEDLAQDLMLRFLRQGYAERGLDTGKERALLARMAYHGFVDALRRGAHRYTATLVEDALPTEGPSGLRERVELVRDLVARAGFCGDDTELLEWRFGEGLTLSEIAERRACHVNTVRKQLNAVLDRMRRLAGPSVERSAS